MAEKKVDIDAIRGVAKKFEAANGPAAYLRNAAQKLEDAKLSHGALTLIGDSTVDAHNEAAEQHRDNLATGADHMSRVAQALYAVAANWEKSDQPWVVK